jgi:malate dehydrogenase (oxaloacetate-decarboxylating)(NADP+)
LVEELDIPVMHDDQHGTAIFICRFIKCTRISREEKIENAKIIVSGAGSAALACANLYVQLGVSGKYYHV